MQLDPREPCTPRGQSHKKQVLHTQRPSLGRASRTSRQQEKDSLSPQSDARAPGLVPLCCFTDEALPPPPPNRLQFCLPHREGTRLENLGAGTSRRSPYRVPGFADAALSPTEVSEGVSPQDHSRSGERQKANLCCLLVLPTPSPPPSLRGHDEQRPRALVSPSHTRVEHSRDHSTGS